MARLVQKVAQTKREKNSHKRVYKLIYSQRSGHKKKGDEVNNVNTENERTGQSRRGGRGGDLSSREKKKKKKQISFEKK